MSQIIPIQRRRESLGWLEVLSRIAPMLTIDPNPELPDLLVIVKPHPHDKGCGLFEIKLSGNYYVSDREKIGEAAQRLYDYLLEVRPEGWGVIWRL